jgi:CBS domain-containing protein
MALHLWSTTMLTTSGSHHPILRALIWAGLGVGLARFVGNRVRARASHRIAGAGWVETADAVTPSTPRIGARNVRTARTAADVMTRGVRAMQIDDTVQLAAQAMDELNVGSIPVCDEDRVVGIVTDRDIVIRGVAQGLSLDHAQLRHVMSTSIECVHENDPIEVVAARMERGQIRRLPVLDEHDHLLGMVSLGDIAVKAGERTAGHALADISEPAQPDRSFNTAASDNAGGGSASGTPTPGRR